MLIFTNDPQKGPCATDSNSRSLMPAFLMEDLQSASGLCARILSKMEELRQGDRATWEAIFNAHAINMDAQRVQIEPLFHDAPSQTLLFEEFMEIIDKWAHFIAAPK